jgi:hypothetical protein
MLVPYEIISYKVIYTIGLLHSIKTSCEPKIDTSFVGIMKMLSYFRRNALGHLDPQVEIDKNYVVKIFSDTKGIRFDLYK